MNKNPESQRSPDKQALNLRMDSDVILRLKMWALKHGCTVSELVERLAVQHLDKEGY